MKLIQCTQILNEESLIEANLKNHYDCFDKIIIIDGAVLGRSENHVSTDKTAQIILDFPDIENKISFWQRNTFWKNLEELKEAFLGFIKNDDWFFIIDADEFYNPDDIKRIRKYIEYYPEAIEFIPVFIHFFKSYKYIFNPDVIGCLHQRILKQREGLSFLQFHPTAFDNNTNDTFFEKTYQEKRYVMPDINIYHTSYLKSDEFLKAKTEFYYKHFVDFQDKDVIKDAKHDIDVGLYENMEKRYLNYDGFIPEVLKESVKDTNFRIAAKLPFWREHDYYKEKVENRKIPTIPGSDFYNYVKG